MSGRRQIASSENGVTGKSTTSQNRLGVGKKDLIGCEPKTDLTAQHVVLRLRVRDRTTWLGGVSIPSRSAETATSTSTGPVSRCFGDPLVPIEWSTMQSQPSEPIPRWRRPHGSGQELRKGKYTTLTRTTFRSTEPRSRRPSGTTLRCKEGCLHCGIQNDELFRHLPRLQLDAGILTAMDRTNCTSCRRCTKVCSRKVMCLHGIDDKWSASYE